MEKPVPPDEYRPAPYLPKTGIAANGEEDYFGAANKVFKWDVAYRTRHPAVGGVVPVVTHHEVVTFRHLIHSCIIADTVAYEIKNGVDDAVWQRFLISGKFFQLVD